MTNIASAAMSFAGTMESARAQANTDKYNQKVAENNAEAIRGQGVAAVEAQVRQFQRALGSMRASYGGTGVDTTVGSPMEVLADSVRSGTLDQLTTKYNYTVAENTQLDQASLYKTAAKNAQRSGWFNALANGLSSFTSGQVNSGGYGSQQSYATPTYAFGGNSLTPGSTYTGPGSLSTSWGGDGANSFNGMTGSGTYTGQGSTAVTWGGFGGGWG